ncbi:MAG: hypothetical protein IJ052_05975 [Oscillospiraceae bacterium]|nr:hypothetical protein [Oscillospiraceae bacterium]
MEAAGQDTSEAAAKISYWNKRQDDFLQQTGFKRQQSREEIAGFTWKDQKAASEQEKTRLDMIASFRAKMSAAGYKTEGFDTYYGDQETLDHMVGAFERMSNLYPDEAKDVWIRWAYDKDVTKYGWYDPADGSIGFNQNAMGNWEDIRSQYADLVKKLESPKGTDADAIFYHEFGHRVWYARGGGSLKKSIDKVLFDMGFGRVGTNYRDELLGQELCTYAAERTRPSYQEAVAEAFAEWYNSTNPRRFCETFLKEVGIIS